MQHGICSVLIIGYLSMDYADISLASLQRHIAQLYELMEQPEAAITCYQQLLAAYPNDNAVISHLGALLVSQGRLDEAYSLYQPLLAQQELPIKLHYQIAICLIKLKHDNEALPHFEYVRQRHPELAEGHFYVGAILHKRGAYSRAQPLLEKAVALKPGNIDYQLYLADNWIYQHDYTQALQIVRQAFELNTTYKPTLSKLAYVLWLCRDCQSAITYYQKVMALDPDDYSARASLGRCQIQTGDYEKGWANYEYRHRLRVPMSIQQSRWQGEALGTKTLLIYQDQGIGDAFNFLRFIPRIEKQQGRIVLAIKPEMMPLLRSNATIIDRFVPLSECPKESFDYAIEISSLPHLFKVTEATLLPCYPLTPAIEKHNTWGVRLRDLKGLKVGLVWSGNPDYQMDWLRSTQLSCLLPLSKLPGICCISLQTECTEADKAMLVQHNIPDFGSAIQDFADTAALMQSLDWVVGVATAGTHLAAEMNIPVCLLLPYQCDFRWLEQRNDSPWYPSMTLFWQATPGDWSSVVEQVMAHINTTEC